MCPVKTIVRPGIIMSQRGVDLTWLPLGKFIVNCFVAGRMFLTGVPSIMNMNMAPVSSATACNVAIFIALRYWGVGALNKYGYGRSPSVFYSLQCCNHYCIEVLGSRGAR
jgi:hypothetical protein